MENYYNLTVFRQELFDKLDMTSTDIPVIGEIDLNKEEKSILMRTPKFAIPENLKEHTLMEDMEKAFAKIRMELRDDETVEDESEPTAPIIASKEDEEGREQEKEEVARSRQIFDPEKRIFDDRNRRATDLAECSRVTLPRPLNIIREAQIETRRELYNKIFQKYRKENCSSKGEQESGLSKEEKKGLEMLQKRIKEGELVSHYQVLK